MRMTTRLTSTRKATNVSLSADLVADAKELGINLSRACEAGLAAALKAERKRRWQEENAGAAEASNAYLAQHGLPLARYRRI